MIELVYISKANTRFGVEALKDMLTAFRQNNHLSDITGLLLYDGYGTFIQLLEGEEETVKVLYDKIKEDTRHSRINLLHDGLIINRSFPQWKMGFRNLSNMPILKLDGYSDFMHQENRQAYLQAKPSFAISLLNYFKHASTLDLQQEHIDADKN